MTTFETLVTEAENAPFFGWDFRWLDGRWRQDPPSWNYHALVRSRFADTDALLDLGTGGGEILAALAPLPHRTVATEAYPPNVEIARRRLEPLGIEIVAVEPAPDNMHMSAGEGRGNLPFPENTFPLIINRHESYYADEVHRVLTPGGTYLTQQVGCSHLRALCRALDEEGGLFEGWTLRFACDQLRSAGFGIVAAREEFPETWFRDIGAVVYYLRAVPWRIPDFTVERYRSRLLTLHERMERESGLWTPGHVFYVEACKLPSSTH